MSKKHVKLDEPTIVQGKVIFPLEGRDVLDELLRHAVSALGNVGGEAFIPETKVDRAFLDGKTKNLDRVALVLPRYSESAGYENSWLSVTVDTLDPKPLGVIFIGVHMGHPGEQIDLEWKIGLEVMPRLVTSFNPTLAFMTAKLVEIERKVFPPNEPIRGSALPSLFTPWTYFDAATLTADVRTKLEALPATASAPLGRGWKVQAVDRVQDDPHPRFIEALHSLIDVRIEYLAPALVDEE